MPQGKPHRPVSPVRGGSYGRVDQGVDWNQNVPYVSLGDGVVYDIGGFAPGEGVASHTAVYIKLDHPIRVNGRVYDEIYYAESAPLVKVGQRVKAGQPVMAAGGSEIGFASGSGPLAPLVGGLGGGTQPSEAGHDFLDLIQGKATFDYSPHAQADALTASSMEAQGNTGGRGQQPSGGSRRALKAQGFQTSLPSVMEQDQLQPFSPQESGGPSSASGVDDFTGLPIGQAASVWQQLAQDSNASPETKLLSDNARALIQNIPSSLL